MTKKELEKPFYLIAKYKINELTKSVNYLLQKSDKDEC